MRFGHLLICRLKDGLATANGHKHTGFCHPKPRPVNIKLISGAPVPVNSRHCTTAHVTNSLTASQSDGQYIFRLQRNRLIYKDSSICIDDTSVMVYKTKP